MTDVSLPMNRFAENEFRAGRVLNRTFSILMRNLAPFCVVTVIAALPRVLIVAQTRAVLPAHGAPVNPHALVVAGEMMALVGILSLILGPLSQAIVLYGAFEDMRGRPVSLFESLRIGLRRFFPILGIAFLTMIFALLAAFLLIFPVFIVLTMLFVSTPACVVERLGPFKSMRRSAQLTKGHRWKIFGLLAATLIGAMIAESTLVKSAAGMGGQVFSLVVMLAWSALWGAFYSIMAVVIYHDLRVAKEGVDTDQIASVFD
jgi:hypothetical protein